MLCGVSLSNTDANISYHFLYWYVQLPTNFLLLARSEEEYDISMHRPSL